MVKKIKMTCQNLESFVFLKNGKFLYLFAMFYRNFAGCCHVLKLLVITHGKNNRKCSKTHGKDLIVLDLGSLHGKFTCF